MATTRDVGSGDDGAPTKRVFVTRRIPPSGLAVLAEDGVDVKFWDSDEAIPRPELMERLRKRTTDGLFCMLTDQIDGEVLEVAGPSLKVVSTMSVGYEHIDLWECRRRGITVANTPGVSTNSVAECTVSLLLLTCRRLLEGVAAVKNGEWGKWKPMWLCGRELTNCTVGILGLGRIGYGVAKRLVPFGVSKIIYNDVCESQFAKNIGAEFMDFDDLLCLSDIICICCNLTEDTKHKFNKDAFKRMKKTAILINTGRGGIIHHDDLYTALVEGEIARVGLDVTDPEPLPVDHKLHSLSNCIITPHMGSNTWETRNNMAEIAARNIVSVFKGEKPPGIVTIQ